MTTLCPAVQENIIRLQVMDEESGEVYAEHVRKNVTLQAEYERERVKKESDMLFDTLMLRYDGEEHSINPLHLSDLKNLKEHYYKRLGIEQEEKKK